MSAMSEQWNVVVVVADTLRTAYMGAYGNDWIRTPNMDRLAREGTLFSRAHPESLPTIPTRRTLHTGRRAFPFRDYRPVPWDNVYLPGWQPMSPEEGTIAEALVQQGYHTGFFADVPHYFVPGMNFTRGFKQWQFVRGQAEDRLNAAVKADPALLSRYLGNAERIRAHLVNVRPELPEENWHAPRVFRGAIEFVEENAGNQPFYLYVDSFAPHETWEAPLHYFDLYGSREEREPMCITVPYGPLERNPEIEERLPSLRANYAGLVTMVDTWFGKLLDTIDRLGMGEKTLVVLSSDHGTNFAENPERVTGKPAEYMYPGTMDIPLIVRHPEGQGAGQVRDELVYSLDIPATVMAGTGVEPVGAIEGQSLLPLVEGGDGFEARDYVTCRYGNSVWYRDDRTWFFSRGDFSGARVFDLEADPDCQVDIAEGAEDRIGLARERILADAGGDIPIYVRQNATDALGRPVFAEE
ncbi:MAG: sulfatase [Gemmatimonadetes bacterium]|jgi:arylsulfatase A-like enzyme|nr:sulfatase [Gemmatimonadota bacterium]